MLPLASCNPDGGTKRESRLRRTYENRGASLNILLTPVIDCNRQPLIFDGLLPFIPKIDRTTIRFVLRFIDSDPAGQQTGVTDNQSLSCIKSGQNVAKSAKAIGK